MQDIVRQKKEECDTIPQRRRFLCPACSKHTVLWLLPTTEVKDLPIKCKLCGRENIITIIPTADI